MSVAQLQSASASKLVAFENADVVSGIVPDTHFLIVRGEVPCLNMEVALAPLIYVDCPDYWAIEVTGMLKGGFCLEATKPYYAVIPLTGVVGREGVEVVGGNKSQKFRVSGGCS